MPGVITILVSAGLVACIRNDELHHGASLVPPQPLPPHPRPPVGIVPPPPPLPLRSNPQQVANAGNAPVNPFAAARLGLKKVEESGDDKLKAKKEAWVKGAYKEAPDDVADAEFIPDGRHAPLTRISQAFESSPSGWGAKLLLVDFFAFSCTNCIRAMPHLKDIYERFQDKGLEILAFARPEFQFEGEVEQVKRWMKMNDIKYPVATDALGTNYETWEVNAWPTTILVQNTSKGVQIRHIQKGDRNTHLLYNSIRKWLGMERELEEFQPMNEELFTDAEIFMGLDHRSKNQGENSCNKERACTISDSSEVDVSKVADLPLPQSSAKYLIFGTQTCPFCRMAKALLTMAGEQFQFVDLTDFGGSKAALMRLKELKMISEHWKTIPMIFSGSNFLGGFDDLRKEFPGFSIEDIKKETALPPAIEYSRDGSVGTITLPNHWAIGKEKLTASLDGAELKVNMLMKSAEQGFGLYLVCGPGSEGKGRITSARHPEGRDVEFPARHYFARYDGAKLDDTLRFSKGMEVFVFWFSSEPVSEAEHS